MKKNNRLSVFMVVIGFAFLVLSAYSFQNGFMTPTIMSLVFGVISFVTALLFVTDKENLETKK